MALAKWVLLLALGEQCQVLPYPRLCQSLSPVCTTLPHSGATTASLTKETQEGERQRVLTSDPPHTGTACVRTSEAVKRCFG